MRYFIAHISSIYYAIMGFFPSLWTATLLCWEGLHAHLWPGGLCWCKLKLLVRAYRSKNRV